MAGKPYEETMTDPMTHPLMQRLIGELGWPLLSDRFELEAWLAEGGMRCVFAPGEIDKNLETADACVILPELRAGFKNAFECAVAAPDLDLSIRQETKTYKAPGFLFYRDGAFIDAISKIRDWDDYVTRIGAILNVQNA